MSNSHIYANECLACGDDFEPVKIKVYKGLNCEKPWNKDPRCARCRKRMSWQFKDWMLKNGWHQIRKSWKRKDARDWESE